jgi:lysophospholipase L1-like esterase
MSNDRSKDQRFWKTFVIATAGFGLAAQVLALALGFSYDRSGGQDRRADRLVSKSREVPLPPVPVKRPRVNRTAKADFVRRKRRVATLPPPPPPRPTTTPPPKLIAATGRPLGRFYAGLAALESGLRQEPLTILHIGDSHVSSDAFSKSLRRRLQQRFGDAGRGMVIPAGAYKYAIADGVTLQRTGPWRAYNSMKHKSGPYGLSGVRLVAGKPRARLAMTLKRGHFTWAEVTVATGPREGRVRLTAGGRTRLINARAGRPGARTIRLEATARMMSVTASGGGRTTVLNWASGVDQPGIRYVNFGLAGATAAITKRWDKTLIARDVRALKPQLIIFGFGTNEGFNDRLDLAAYKRHVAAFLAQLKTVAPDAEILILGPADSARRPRFSGRGSGGQGGCAVLPAGTNYGALIKRKSARLSRWHAPPRLGQVRRTLRDLAAELKAGYWDWARAMGGPCSIQKWATARPRLAAADRVHLTQRGYDKSAQLLIDHLYDGLAQSQRIAATQ